VKAPKATMNGLLNVPVAGPFPGMDPYLELQTVWPDFHNRLIAEICNELGTSLPDSYFARDEERIEVVNWAPEPTRSFRPDDLVGRFEKSAVSSGITLASPHSATLEPKLVEILDRDPEELRITWVEIRVLPELDLVTAIEVLSPIKKSGPGRQSYLDKRDKLNDSRVNLVEIDLLLGGAPLPMKERIEPGAYYAIVARGARLPLAVVYRWTVRGPLPRIRIPLRDPDPAVPIELAASVTRVDDLGRYARTLRHGPPLPETTSLTPDDRAWVESHFSHSEHRNG
jgi:Protein of unknown function (DUF4058)